MKKYILLLSIFIISTAISSVPNDTNEILILKVKLVTQVDENSLPPYCGIFMFCGDYEYEIIKVIKGNYTEETIIIRTQCPRSAFESGKLKTGKIYTYHVKKTDGVSACDKEGSENNTVVYTCNN